MRRFVTFGMPLVLLCMAGATSAAADLASPAGERAPDIVLVVLDDVSPLLLERAGGPVHTPNVDRLARAGLEFERAYAVSPLCNPSRAALMTGLRPRSSGVYSNGDDWRSTRPDLVSFPQQLRRHGYETVRVGKIEHRSFAHAASWSHVLDPGERPRKLGPSVRPQAPGDSRLRWGATPLAPAEQVDGRVALRAAQFLRDEHHEAFLLAIGFDAPHLPFRAPARFHARYPPSEVALPEVPPDDLADTGIAKAHPDHERLTTDEWRQVRAAHYATISYVDWCLGVVLDAIEETGRGDNTIVVLWSDHGFMLGEHGLWRKRELFEEATRTMLLWYAPGITSPGSRAHGVVEAIDIFPTLLELVGVPAPESIEATSMVPLLRDPQRDWKRGAISLRVAGDETAISLQTERYRLTRHESSGFLELYDREVDPREHHNLATDPQQASVLAELERQLDGGWLTLLPDP